MSSTSGDHPALTWVGCAVAPLRSAQIRGGAPRRRFAPTTFLPRGAAGGMTPAQRQRTASCGSGHTKTGGRSWGSEGVGGNGSEISKAAMVLPGRWAARRSSVIARETPGSAKKSGRVPPRNLRWAADGRHGPAADAGWRRAVAPESSKSIPNTLRYGRREGSRSTASRLRDRRDSSRQAIWIGSCEGTTGHCTGAVVSRVGSQRRFVVLADCRRRVRFRRRAHRARGHSHSKVKTAYTSDRWTRRLRAGKCIAGTPRIHRRQRSGAHRYERATGSRYGSIKSVTSKPITTIITSIPWRSHGGTGVSADSSSSRTRTPKKHAEADCKGEGGVPAKSIQGTLCCWRARPGRPR